MRDELLLGKFPSVAGYAEEENECISANGAPHESGYEISGALGRCKLTVALDSKVFDSQATEKDRDPTISNMSLKLNSGASDFVQSSIAERKTSSPDEDSVLSVSLPLA